MRSSAARRSRSVTRDTRGVHLFRQIFTNVPDAFINADGRLQVPAGAPLRQRNFQRMRLRVSDSTSDYHGLTFGLTRRAGESFQAQVSYTYAFTANVNDTVPFGRDGGGAAWLVRDWNVGGLVRMRSGYPFSALSTRPAASAAW